MKTMKMKNILRGAAALILAAALTGCYEKFTEPGLAPRYDDQWFADEGYTIVPIQTVKDIFSDPNTVLINHLKRDAGAADATMAGASPFVTTTYGRFAYLTDRYVIKGKVISTDAFGNFYRSLYILDEAGDAIEVKVGANGMFTKYRMGETIYVVCEGLVIGNYRTMLSLGLEPLPEDKSDSGEAYANRNMDIQTIIDRHVKLGPETRLSDDEIVVVTSADQITRELGGKLVRFEGLTSVWDTWENTTYPSFLHKLGTATYQVYTFEQAMSEWQAYRAAGSVGTTPTMPEPMNNYVLWPDPENPGQETHLPSWGFQEYRGAGTRNYGSALFRMGADGYVVVRTSGYARFALNPVTPAGRTADITAIVATYTTSSGGYFTYQLMLNNVTDVVEHP